MENQIWQFRQPVTSIDYTTEELSRCTVSLRSEKTVSALTNLANLAARGTPKQRVAHHANVHIRACVYLF